VLTALLNNGLELKTIQEFDYSPHYCFNNMVEVSAKKFHIKHLGDKIPIVYALIAAKK
jgi:hypothetical protein